MTLNVLQLKAAVNALKSATILKIERIYIDVTYYSKFKLL